MPCCTARMIRQHIDISPRLPRSAIVRFAIRYGTEYLPSFLRVYFCSCCCLFASFSAIEIPISICLPSHYSCCSCPLLNLNSGNSGVATSLLGRLITLLVDLTEWLHLCRCIQHRVTLACRYALDHIYFERPAQIQQYARIQHENNYGNGHQLPRRSIYKPTQSTYYPTRGARGPAYIIRK